MIQPPEDRRPPITPQLALRVAVLGGIALALFAVVFFRLWFLQVLSGDEYVVQANDNQIRELRVQAPRGDIVDRQGRRLVMNREATIVQIEPGRMPAAGAPRRALYRRLGRVLDMPPARIQREVIEQRAALPYADVTVKKDVPEAVTGYLAERQARFPGVKVQQTYLRRYPYGTLAAQLLGYVAQVSPEQLEQDRFRGVDQGTVVGQAGVEYEYDRYLRGEDGADLLRVNSLGRYRGYLRRRAPVAGQQLRLSLDLDLQEAGQRALARYGGGRPGAFVAMSPEDGQVLAMGSYPSFDPSVFVPSITQREYDALTDEAQGAPLINRAIEGAYPTGSTFKPITALAALSEGVVSTTDVLPGGACIKVGEIDRCNAGKKDVGPQALPGALKVSSDVYFYRLGMLLNPRQGQPLQRWAERLGLGRRSRLDLPTEAPGLVPDRAWRAQIARRELRCRERRDVPSCGISDARPWSVGDEVNLSIGQGDLLASPLQMAGAYAALENGGRVVRPHLGLAVEDGQGRLVQTIDPPASRRVRMDAGHRAAILEGLRGAAQEEGGTSTSVFAGWPHGRFPVYGKTGTAQNLGKLDQSWYVAFVRDRGRPIVVAVTVEQGGFGAEAAAPAACRMLASWYDVRAACRPGESIDQ